MQIILIVVVAIIFGAIAALNARVTILETKKKAPFKVEVKSKSQKRRIRISKGKIRRTRKVTKTQIKTYKALEYYIGRYGKSPKIEELAVLMNIPDGTAGARIASLKRKGLITGSGRKRSIRLVYNGTQNLPNNN